MILESKYIKQIVLHATHIKSNPLYINYSLSNYMPKPGLEPGTFRSSV